MVITYDATTVAPSNVKILTENIKTGPFWSFEAWDKNNNYEQRDF